MHAWALSRIPYGGRAAGLAASVGRAVRRAQRQFHRNRVAYAPAMSLELILVRHAIAFERDRARWRDDGERPLSPEGKRKFRKAVAGLMKIVPKVDAVLTSPLARTRQTADILTAVAHWPEAVDTPELAPSGSPMAVLTVLRGRQEPRV